MTDDRRDGTGSGSAGIESGADGTGSGSAGIESGADGTGSGSGGLVPWVDALDPRWWPRIVLVVGIYAGLQNAAGLALYNPPQVGIATDVYYHAAETVLSGGDLYAVTPPDHPGFHFVYPPAWVVVFLPFAFLGSLASYAVWSAVNVLTGLALGVVLLREIEEGDADLGRADRWLVVAYALGSSGAATTVVLGQVNLQLALGIAVGARWIDGRRAFVAGRAAADGGHAVLDRGRAATLRHRRTVAGAVLGAVASVKLFPALVGAWLLRLRAWRAIAGATATGLGIVAAGAALFGPGVTETYVTETLAREASVATFAGGPDPGSPYVTVRRQLSVVAPGIPEDWLLPVALGLLAPVVAAASRTVATRRDRLVALGATLLATLAAFPLEHFYLSLALFPTVALVYLLDGPERPLFLAGALVASLPIRLGVVENWAALLPPGAESAVMEATRALFSFALPPTFGVWAMLAACVLYQHRAVRRNARSGADPDDGAPATGEDPDADGTGDGAP